MSCCATPHKGAYPISAYSICLCFTVLSLLVADISYSFCNPSAYRIVFYPFPFLCFWLPLSHHKSSFYIFYTEKIHFSCFPEQEPSCCLPLCWKYIFSTLYLYTHDMAFIYFTNINIKIIHTPRQVISSAKEKLLRILPVVSWIVV